MRISPRQNLNALARILDWLPVKFANFTFARADGSRGFLTSFLLCTTALFSNTAKAEQPKILAFTDDVEITGFVAVEGRAFTDSERYAGQNHGDSASVIVEPEAYWVSDDDRHQFAFRPFYRYDSNDDARTHFDVRDLYYLNSEDDYEFLIGVNTLFHGVTESRHLVNIVNQVDTLEDIDEEEYLGQPMAMYARFTDWGTLRGYVLPYFRERTFPGPDGRLRGPIVVDSDKAEYESAREEWHTDFMLRYNHFFGPFDVGLSHFYGTAREPVLIPTNSANNTGILIPYYELINQTGLDVQATFGNWLWKMEGIVREGQGSTFLATVAGLEYTFFGISDTNMDLGIVAEYLYDGRDSEAPPTLLQNDVFMGARLTFNDQDDTNILAGTIVDVENTSMSFQVEADTRLTDRYKLEITARYFANPDEDDLMYSIQDDHHILVRLSRFF